MNIQKRNPPQLPNRVKWIDRLKAIAVLMVLSLHLFQALSQFDINIIGLNSAVFEYSANCSWGDCGVAIFFFVSGAALMCNYSECCDMKSFYLKRIKSIYPMFFIAWVFSFLTRFYIDRSIPQLPFVKIFYTILGIDGYLSQWTSTFYLLGEWFLGMIIVVYAVFPLLRVCIKKYCICTLAVLYTLSAVFIRFQLMDCPANRIPFVCLFTVALGMAFVEKEIQIPTATLILSAACMFIFYYFAIPSLLPMRFNYLPYSIISCIIGLHKAKLPYWMNAVIGKICKYSYPIFLLHHRLLFNMSERFRGQIFRLPELLAFIAIWIIVLYFFCVLLLKTNDWFVTGLRNSHSQGSH